MNITPSYFVGLLQNIVSTTYDPADSHMVPILEHFTSMTSGYTTANSLEVYASEVDELARIFSNTSILIGDGLNTSHVVLHLPTNSALTLITAQRPVTDLYKIHDGIITELEKHMEYHTLKLEEHWDNLVDRMDKAEALVDKVVIYIKDYLELQIKIINMAILLPEVTVTQRVLEDTADEDEDVKKLRSPIITPEREDELTIDQYKDKAPPVVIVEDTDIQDPLSIFVQDHERLAEYLTSSYPNATVSYIIPTQVLSCRVVDFTNFADIIRAPYKPKPIYELSGKMGDLTEALGASYVRIEGGVAYLAAVDSSYSPIVIEEDGIADILEMLIIPEIWNSTKSTNDSLSDIEVND